MIKLIRFIPAVLGFAIFLNSTDGVSVSTSFGYVCNGKPDCGACADGGVGICTASVATSICVGLGFGPGVTYVTPEPAVPGDCFATY